MEKTINSYALGDVQCYRQSTGGRKILVDDTMSKDFDTMMRMMTRHGKGNNQFITPMNK